MTVKEYENRTKTLRRNITCARNKVAEMPTLAGKIAQKLVAKAAEQELQQHLLNRFELVTAN